MLKQREENKKPVPKEIQPITTQGLNYLQRRGISKETTEKMKVGSDERGNIVTIIWTKKEIYS